MREISAENKIFGLKPLSFIGILAILQVAIAFLTEPMIFSFDESMWQYIGRNWFRNGLVPYAGGVDNKSPLIFLIFGISDWLFGVNFWFPRLLGTLTESVGVFLIFKIAEKSISRRAALFAISFYGLSLLWRSTGGKYVSYTETYAVTAILAAIWFTLFCARKKYSFIGGFIAGLGFGFRFSAGFGIAPLFLFAIRKNRKAAILFLAGLISAIILLVLLAFISGIQISEFLLYGFTDNFSTGSPTDHSLAWKAQAFADGFFYSELLLFYPAVFYYFILNRKIDFLKVWLFSEFLGIIVIGIFDRVHFKNLLPVMSLMSAFVVNWLLENYKMNASYLLMGIWILFFPKTFEPLFAIKRIFISQNSLSASDGRLKTWDEQDSKKKIGLWLRSNTMPGEKIFIAGYSAEIQAYSERVSPSIYFNVTQTPRARKKLFADLNSNMPALVVIPLSDRYTNSVSADIRSFVNRIVENNYVRDTSLYNYAVFRYKK